MCVCAVATTKNDKLTSRSFVSGSWTDAVVRDILLRLMFCCGSLICVCVVDVSFSFWGEGQERGLMLLLCAFIAMNINCPAADAAVFFFRFLWEDVSETRAQFRHRDVD